jgi:hypothetical protein
MTKSRAAESVRRVESVMRHSIITDFASVWRNGGM